MFSLLIASFNLMQAQEFVMDTVYFEFDDFSVSDSYQANMDSIVLLATKHPSYYIEIFGHTDNIGTDIYNQSLSAKRAENIFKLLVDNGVDKDRIYYEGFGTEKPAATNETFSGRSKNRRAEIAVIYSEVPYLTDAMKLAAEEKKQEEERKPFIEEKEEEPFVLVEEVLEANDKPLTVYTQKRTIINGKEGGRVIIPPFAFDTDEETITMEMIELFQRKDMLMVGMPSVTREGPLETEGMVLLEARDSRGRLVKIKPENPVLVEIPADEALNEMGVYIGKGGNRTGRRRRQAVVKDFNPVKNWTLSEIPVAFKDTGEIGPHYEFKVDDLETFNLGRPVHKSLKTNPKEDGIDIEVKLKGKRFERNTKVLLVGNEYQFFIPLQKRSKRIYSAENIKELDKNIPLTLMAHQHDNRDNPYLGSKTLIIAEDAEMPKEKGFFGKLLSGELFKKKEEVEETKRMIIITNLRFKRLKNNRDFEKELAKL